MFRTTDIALIAVMVSAAAFTYKTKHDAERQLAKLERIRAEISSETDTIKVLKADWSWLTQPSRLQRLSEFYRSELGLRPTEASQIADIDDLPAPPLRIEDILAERPEGFAGNPARIDGTQTGGIKP